MRSSTLAAIAFSLLLIACSPPEAVSLEEELQLLKPPFEYKVKQYAADTGVVEFDNKGSYEEETTFTVLNEQVERGQATVVPQMTMYALKQELWRYVGGVDGQHPAHKVRCYHYEDIGVERATMCFEGRALMNFTRTTTPGNYQHSELRWEVISIS